MVNAVLLFQVGACIFTSMGIGVFVCYMWYMNKSNKKYDTAVKNAKKEEKVKQLKDQWIFPTIFISLFIFASLYMSMYLRQGILIKSAKVLIMWERWIACTLNGLLQSVGLTYFLTLHSNDGQSFFFVFCHTLSNLSMYWATLSDTVDTQLHWLLASIGLFLFATFFYVFPRNKLLAIYHNDTFQYHYWLFALIVVSYTLRVIVFLLSESNQIIRVLGFGGEALSYFFCDILLEVVFAILLVYVSTCSTKNQSIAIKNKKNQTTTLQSIK